MLLQSHLSSSAVTGPRVLSEGQTLYTRSTLTIKVCETEQASPSFSPLQPSAAARSSHLLFLMPLWPQAQADPKSILPQQTKNNHRGASWSGSLVPTTAALYFVTYFVSVFVLSLPSYCSVSSNYLYPTHDHFQDSWDTGSLKHSNEAWDGKSKPQPILLIYLVF